MKNAIMKAAFLCLALSSLALRAAATESEPRPGALSATQVEEIRQALRATHERQHNIGLSAVVMRNGQVDLFECLGLADIENQVPVTPDTRFGIASINKAFTGIALLKILDEERVDLDAPVQRYVPSFPVKPEGAITLRLLAGHLAGIRHWANERTPELYAKHFDDVDDILYVFENDSLVAPPGTVYRYSSHGYNLLAATIQSAAGLSYEDYVQGGRAS